MRTRLGVVTPALILALAFAISVVPSQAAQPDARNPAPQLGWDAVDIDTSQGLRGLDAVDDDTAWVTGSEGGIWRTDDGGTTWADVSPPEGAGLMFRDIEVTGASTAHALAIGEGEDSRIFRTTDAGVTWEQSFVNDEPTAFFNCLSFFPGGKRGLAVSDPVDGKFRIIETRDSGATWSVVPDKGMPAVTPGEFNFAASGTCLVTVGGRDAWMASGGSAARIYHSRDRGHTWSVTDSTIPATPAGGVFSMAFRTPRHGVSVGGDFEVPDNGVDASATTHDGRRWSNGGDLGGYRSGVDWLPGSRRIAIAVGPSGSDLSLNGGLTWHTFSETGFDSVECPSRDACWASGSGGRVARMSR